MIEWFSRCNTQADLKEEKSVLQEGVHMIYSNVLEAVGNTPLIELKRMESPEGARILAKYEAVNIGGSIKTRTALQMIEGAEKKGLLHKGSTIVEATSGNQGIGLALVGAVKGYKVIIIMPDSVSEERRRLVQQYGAKVRLVHDEGNIGECINRCLAMARQLHEDNDYFLPGQFQNEDNVAAHYLHTGKEILEQVNGPVDGFCCGFGTGGTITGIGRALKEKNPEITIIAAEPEHAAILSGGEVGDHIQMGIGDGVIPPILDQSIISGLMTVTDEQALQTSQRLAAEEGLLCGISSGTNVYAAMKLAEKLGRGKTVVTVLPDTGERYFSTPLFNK